MSESTCNLSYKISLADVRSKTQSGGEHNRCWHVLKLVPRESRCHRIFSDRARNPVVQIKQVEKKRILNPPTQLQSDLMLQGWHIDATPSSGWGPQPVRWHLHRALVPAICPGK